MPNEAEKLNPFYASHCINYPPTVLQAWSKIINYKNSFYNLLVLALFLKYMYSLKIKTFCNQVPCDILLISHLLNISSF